MSDPEPTPDPSDPLAMIEAMQAFAETLRGSVAVLVADGWSDEQARTMVLHLVVRGTR